MEVNVEEEAELEVEAVVEVEVLVEMDCYRARENCTQIESLKDNGIRRHCRTISRV